MEQLRARHVRFQVWTWTRMLTVVLCLATTSASAQTSAITDAELPWASGDDPIGVHRDDADLDRGPTTLRAPDAQAFGPKPPALSARNGDVIVAPALVRETQHKVHLEWRAGLTLVTTELHFTTTGSFPAEVKYRLPLPAGATLASLEVCAATGCREGLVEPTGALLGAYDDAVQSRGAANPLPVAHVRAIADERGAALSVRAAPVRANQELVVRVAFLVPTPVRGGVVRLTLPARGTDERAVTAEVTVSAPGLESISLADAPLTAAAALLEPWQPIELVGRFVAASPIATDWLRYRCGDQDCARLWLAAKATTLRTDDVALVLDASPSMRGPARGRIASTIAALLSVLPQDRPVDVAVFGAAARLLIRGVTPTDMTLTPLVDAVHAEDLGSGTRFSAAWNALQAWVDTPAQGSRRKHIVLIGDGTISRNQAGAFEQAKRAHVVVSSVNLSDRETAAELARAIEGTGGIALDVGPQAAQASTHAPGALEEALGTLFAARAGGMLTLHNVYRGRDARINLGTIAAGSQLTWTGHAGQRARILGRIRPHDTTRHTTTVEQLGESRNPTPEGERFGRALSMGPDHPGDGLAAVDPADVPQAGTGRPRPAPQCDPRGPAQRASGISSDLDPVSLAEARHCRPPSAELNAPPPAANAGTGMPASPLLTMLRQRILPVARACFRRDRAGRAEYDLRATFDLELSNQEVTAASVTGNVPESLRACLIEAAERLEVPLFTGTVRARYPLRTQSEPLPEEIELTPGVAADLDRLLDGDRGALHTPPAF